jgi:hypothetical protein
LVHHLRLQQRSQALLASLLQPLHLLAAPTQAPVCSRCLQTLHRQLPLACWQGHEAGADPLQQG